MKTKHPIDVKELLKRFKETRPHMSHNLTEKQVQRWLNNKAFHKEMPSVLNLFEDYLLSQGLCEVQL